MKNKKTMDKTAKYKFLLLTLFVLLPLLVSCSPVSSNWSCKSSLSGTCRTIGEIDNGYDSAKENHKTNLKDKMDVDSSIINNGNGNNDNNNNNDGSANGNNDDSDNISSFDFYRSKEKVARVMFAPYIDEAGNRHDKSVVYYLEQKAEWRQ
jgi:type IV conjugative transfer system lipoprotein TraV